MIHAHGLTKRYGSTLAVDDLSFEVKPGRVTGFLGPNGAGKSTTLRMVMGLDTTDRGFGHGRRQAVHVAARSAVQGRRDVGGRRDPRRALRVQPPLLDRAEQRHRPWPRHRSPRTRRAVQRGQATRRRLLDGHEPTPRHRRRAPRRPRAVDLRRARQRSRPRRHHLDPQPDALARGRGPHRVRLEPLDVGDGAHRGVRHRDRQGQAPRRDQHRRTDRRQLAELRARALRSQRRSSSRCSRPRAARPSPSPTARSPSPASPRPRSATSPSRRASRCTSCRRRKRRWKRRTWNSHATASNTSPAFPVHGHRSSRPSQERWPDHDRRSPASDRSPLGPHHLVGSQQHQHPQVRVDEDPQRPLDVLDARGGRRNHGRTVGHHLRRLRGPVLEPVGQRSARFRPRGHEPDRRDPGAVRDRRPRRARDH